MKNLLDRIRKYSIVYDRKRILKNYYSKEMRKGKTYRASIVDRVLFTIFIYILLIIALYVRGNNFLLSFYMSSLSLYFIGVFVFKIYRNIKNKKMNKIMENIKREKLLSQINNLKLNEFKNYIKILFEKYYDTKVEHESFPIDLSCEIKEEKYYLKCFKLEDKEKVYLRDIDLFLNEIINTKENEGILVTNSSFTGEVKEITNILTYDLEKIVEMVKETDLYDTDSEIEDYIVENFLESRKQVKEEMKILDKNKIVKLYIVSIIFYIFSRFVVYKTYYKIGALSIFIIATLLLSYKFSEYIIIKDKSPYI